MEDYWIKFTNQTKIEYNTIKEENEQLKNIPENAKEPYDFFKLIFDDEYFSKIVNNSNEYKSFKIKKIELESSKINGSLVKPEKSELNDKTGRIERMADVDIQKIEKFIAIEILKGIVKLPSYKDYWSNDDLMVN